MRLRDTRGSGTELEIWPVNDVYSQIQGSVRPHNDLMPRDNL
jgi:hypothetical protein